MQKQTEMWPLKLKLRYVLNSKYCPVKGAGVNFIVPLNVLTTRRCTAAGGMTKANGPFSAQRLVFYL